MEESPQASGQQRAGALSLDELDIEAYKHLVRTYRGIILY